MKKILYAMILSLNAVTTLNAALQYTKQFSTHPLHAAAAKGNIETVTSLIFRDKVEIDGLDSDGRTALHRAAFGGHASTISFLLDAGANIHAVSSKNGMTVLHWAALGGHVGAVQELIKSSIKNINAQNSTGLTALDLAAICGFHEVVELLLEIPGIDTTYLKQQYQQGKYSDEVKKVIKDCFFP